MKNKKIIASVLGIACVAILIGVAVITPKKNHTFTPEASEAASNDSWEEKHTPATTEPAALQESETDATSAAGTDEKTQAVVAEDEKTVVTELNPAVDKEKVQADTKPTAPPADSEKKGRLPSCDIPDSEPVPTSAPQDPKPETVPGSEPAAETANPENSSHEGQVYDPVFGWVTPGAAQGQVVDNDGDINKQVGTIN